MDTGEGHFKKFPSMEELKNNMHDMFNTYPNHGGVFQEGEELIIKGSRFKVVEILNKGLALELLPSVKFKEK